MLSQRDCRKAFQRAESVYGLATKLAYSGVCRFIRHRTQTDSFNSGWQIARALVL